MMQKPFRAWWEAEGQHMLPCEVALLAEAAYLAGYLAAMQDERREAAGAAELARRVLAETRQEGRPVA